MGRHKNPDALTADERTRRSRALRKLRMVGLPSVTVDALDALLRPGEHRPAAIARLIADEMTRQGPADPKDE